MLYHTVRGQSVIKLYVIYNMLEVICPPKSRQNYNLINPLSVEEPELERNFGTTEHYPNSSEMKMKVLPLHRNGLAVISC